MSVRGAALWSMGTYYLGFLIQFGTSVIIARFFLAPEDVGLFSIALAAAMMLSIFQDFGITRFLSGSPDLTPERAGHCATVSLLVSWFIAIAVILTAGPVAGFYGDERLVLLLRIIGASYLLLPFSTVSAALLVRDMNYRALFWVNTGCVVVNNALALWLASRGHGAASLAWGTLGYAVVKAVMTQCYRPNLPRWPMSRADASPILGFGSLSTVLSISGAIGIRSQDLIVGRLLGVVATGLFSRSYALVSQLSGLLTGAINMVFYPAFARLRDQGEPLGPPYIRLVAGNTAINWAAMAGLAAAATPLVLLLYGPNWHGVAPLLRWTALSEILFVALPLQVDLPIIMGRIKTIIWYNLVDTFISVLILVVACTISLEAAAMSRMVYGAAWLAVYGHFQWRLVGFDLRTMLTNYAKSAIAAIAAVTPMLLAYGFWRSPEMLGFDGLVVTTSLGIACWLIILRAIRHPAAAEIDATLVHLTSVLSGFVKKSPAA